MAYSKCKLKSLSESWSRPGQISHDWALPKALWLVLEDRGPCQQSSCLIEAPHTHTHKS